MHELSIAENIKNVVEESLKGKKVKVTCINLKIGKLTAVVPESLQFCFQFVSKGTAVDGAVLKIKEIPVRARCKKCGNEFSIDSPLFLCPICGSGKIDVLSGNELLIKSVEIEED
ncbi:MAG: hydrogenase maturation nickel metallochaperone HypA [Candidatus Cloacimonas sp. 4484_209]|nr:MAG: hydrogenase maturation nickel metallochaperone HypA [Candidatus Cloacimonas sp. 4484_209]